MHLRVARVLTAPQLEALNEVSGILQLPGVIDISQELEHHHTTGNVVMITGEEPLVTALVPQVASLCKRTP